MLGSHPNLYAVPYESNFAFKDNPQKILRRFERAAITTGKGRWVEKTPKHIRRIDHIFQLRPEAKVLIMLRDGRDVACSIRDRTGSIEKGIKRWVEDNRAGGSYLSHPNVLTVRYESLVTSFEPTIRGILDFIGEPFTPEVLEYHLTPKHYYSETVAKPPSAFGRYHKQYRNWQINQPIFDGRGKWKCLSDEEKLLIKSQANDLLISFGYVDSGVW
jgi:hypothetical protein